MHDVNRILNHYKFHLYTIKLVQDLNEDDPERCDATIVILKGKTIIQTNPIKITLRNKSRVMFSSTYVYDTVFSAFNNIRETIQRLH